MRAGASGERSGSGVSLDFIGWRQTGAVAVVLGLAVVPGFPLGVMANFGGYDEWLFLSLTSQGIVSFPYANRPLALVWALPGVLGLPSTLAGYLAAHVGYLLATALMVFALARRLARGDTVLALLAAASAGVWVPLDTHRLNPLNNLKYSEATCAAVLALLLFVEWALGRGVVTFVVGILAALLASRSYEGTLGLLVLGAPLLLIAVRRELRRPVWLTLLAWEGPMLGLGVLAVLPLLGASAGTYQTSALGLDISVSGVLGRLVQQLSWHLGPLIRRPPGTGWTLALERGWEERDTLWPAQSRILRQLVEIAPDLRPSTLVVLLDADRVFGATFPFRHAIRYLYEGRALGVVPEGHPFLYPTRFEEQGVVTEPFPSIRQRWSEPVTRHGYDEIVVLRHAGGRLTLLEEWPFPGRRDGAAASRYAPRARLVPGPPPERGRILGDER